MSGGAQFEHGDALAEHGESFGRLAADETAAENEDAAALGRVPQSVFGRHGDACGHGFCGEGGPDGPAARGHENGVGLHVCQLLNRGGVIRHDGDV